MASDRPAGLGRSCSLERSSHQRSSVFRFKQDQGDPNITSRLSSAPADGIVAPCLTPPRRERAVAKTPFKVLDMPELPDDFYMDLMDWSSQNLLAVAIGCCIYLWNAATEQVQKLGSECGQPVSSVAWSQRGTYLAAGGDSGAMTITDAATGQQVRRLRAHRGRVGALAWAGPLLASGSWDRTIRLTDVRAPGCGSCLGGHASEVCGLKWAPGNAQLASGGNDNAVAVWAPGAGAAAAPLWCLRKHTAAVKALAWSPHQAGLLASGGGTSDRHIRIWNTTSGALVNAVDTGSQVCALAWSANVNELVSCHGYSTNAVNVWRYPGLQRVATLGGHTQRVLYLALSPDGRSIVTGAGQGDETIRFWSVFPAPRAAGAGTGLPMSMRSCLR
ncbi:hypothetical protein WJX81_002430 [Elliptochloris bilobata]|uniref:CDC20/Fizzy WD40 domain-containing protein n=1 Tax=Elliptochloris bilobata TaxID=381761 RepID=A0AAW1QYD1_9CHLO